MSDNQGLREEIILNAEAVFLDLMQQLDFLFNCTEFWVQRYTDSSHSTAFKRRELDITSENIATLCSQLAEHISRWKAGEKASMSRLNIEVNILNELWANIQALLYFLSSHEIDLEEFDGRKTIEAIKVMVRANRIL